MNQSINKKKFIEIDIVGDGNCLFRAISFFLYNTQDKHALVRQTIVEYITKVWNKMSREIKIEHEIFNVAEYRDKMSRLGFYGGACEIHAATFIYRKSFIVHQDNTEILFSTTRKNGGNISPPPFHLIYYKYGNNNGHYNCLVPFDIKNTNINTLHKYSQKNINQEIKYKKIKVWALGIYGGSIAIGIYLFRQIFLNKTNDSIKFKRRKKRFIDTNFNHYIPFTKHVQLDDDNENNQDLVDCNNHDYLTQHECDMADPINSCKHCRGIMHCQNPLDEKHFEITTIHSQDHVIREEYINNDIYGILFPKDKTKGKCLPINEFPPCNPFVGKIILAKHNGISFWYCKELYPSIIKKPSYFEEPSIVAACSGNGTLVNPQTQIPWIDEKNYSPELATCKCNGRYVPSDINEFGNAMSCIKNPCHPGKTITGSNECYCPPGTMSCPSPYLSTDEIKIKCPMALKNNYFTCIKDICKESNSKSYFVKYQHKCRGIYIDHDHPESSVLFNDDFLPSRGLPYKQLPQYLCKHNPNHTN
ncbi:hypothetical protein PV326_013432 [Microctonus aethiopoides]|nr:hypothetical protein PV326_013432 [Microctonus aethiopoides]